MEDKGATDKVTTSNEDINGRGRSPSVASVQAPVPGSRKKGKKQPGMSETLEEDGHLPGYKDGVGVFPSGSDWSELMLALKLKGMCEVLSVSCQANLFAGKRYRTKKERMRMERGGPPVAADGSIDYPESELPIGNV